MRRLVLGVLGGAVLYGSMGCAQERAPINRVQADALSKHFFVGASLSDPTDDPEFYMSNRIVDEPYGNGQGFLIQSLGSIARIKWEIDETELIARLTYDRIQNSDYKGTTKTNDGQVVAVFNIVSHFDIIRDYNPQTGEELNIVTENTTDRPWYEREFFRVDWSTNKVTDAYDFDIFAQEGIFSGVKYDPLNYYIEDPNDPNAPVFSQDDGYFDITAKVFATPQTVNTPYGNFPYCFFFGQYPAIDCNPAEITVRTAFKAVGDHDYEPTDWNGQRMDAFGWFYVDRYGYDRNYGILDEDWHRFAAKYNIWQQSHIKDSQGNYAQCAIDAWRDKNGQVINYQTDGQGHFLTDPQSGLPIPAAAGDPKGQPFTKDVVGENVHASSDGVTEDVCRFTDANGNTVHPGSRCDEFSNKCDLPLYERQIKTIPWYYGDSAPPDLFDTTAKPLNSWNLAVKRAAQLGKVVEANRAGINIGQVNPGQTDSGPSFPTSEADIAADEALGSAKLVPDVFVLCHNPVVAGDDPACGPVGLHARLGDLRYNLVNVINAPQNPSPWGVMDDADDPVTGEKIVTSVNEWGAVLDQASQSVEDLLRWLNGEISDQQIASGQYLRDWVNASKLGTGSYQPKTLTKDQIQTRLNSVDMTMAKMNGLSATQKQYAPQLRAKIATNNLSQSLGPSLDSQFESFRQAAIGSEWEAQLANSNMLQMAGLDPSTPVAGNDTALSMASELRGLNPKFTKWVNSTRNKALMDRGACMIEQPEPDSLVGMAHQAQAMFPLPDTNDPNYPALKNKRDQALHQWIREQFHLSVIAHEMGHSMGLRHNFTGSMDALNYHPEYWQLRTNNNKVHFCAAGKWSPGATLDAYTPHIWNDLGANGTQPKTASDCIGPRWVDPITDNEVEGLIWKWGSSTVMDYPGDQTQDMNDIGLYDKAAMRFGYADVVDVEKDFTVQNFTARTDAGGNPADDASRLVNALDGFGYIFGLPIGGVHYTTYNDKFHLLGDCSQQRDPNVPIDPNNPLTAKCSGSNLDYVAFRDMRNVNKLSAYFTQANPNFGDGGVAYFGADAQGRVRHPYMFGSDEFADFGNVSVFRFDSGADPYEQQEFLISTYENRYIFNNFRRDRVTFETYTAVDRTLTRYWDKIQGVAKSLALGVGSGVSITDPGQLMAHALGASDGLAMFVRALTRPEPGAYVIANDPNSQCVAPTILGPDSPPQPTAQAAGLFLASPPAACTPFAVALGSGEGRYLHNDYDYSQGYNWFDYQIQVGTAYEKYFSTFYLLEGYNQFISNTKEDYIDGRYKNLSYATLYPDQMRRLFANLTQNGMGAIAPFMINQSGAVGQIQHVQYLPWEQFDPNNAATINLDYPAGATLLDPLYGWEEQFRALFWGFYFGRTTLKMDTVDQMRVFSPGGADSLDIPLNQQVHYADPTTGIVYVARNYGTETVNSQLGYPTAKSSGARMIQWANILAQAAFQVTAVDPVTGQLTYATDSSGNPLPSGDPNQATIATELRNFSSNLDVARKMTYWFGYGPPIDPSP